MVEPDQLSRPGLTAEECAAYAINYAPRLQAELEACRDRVEERLRAVLAHAGAEFKNYQERGEVYRVTYEVEGCRHTLVVAQNDLSVQVAGICLSGEDDHFDLQSLVGVLREAQGSHGFVRVGRDHRGMPEEDYWRGIRPHSEASGRGVLDARWFAARWDLARQTHRSSRWATGERAL